MPSPTKTPVTPEGLPVDSQRGLRRVVLGSSVATSMLLGLILAFTGPGETAPAAATPPPEVAPGAETYPVPPQAAGEVSPVIAPIAVDREAATKSPADQDASPTHKTNSEVSKAARNHVIAHKPIAAAHLDARTRGHGTIAAGAAPPPPEVFPNTDANVAAPEPEIKKPVPLVDEPSRE